MRLIQASKTQRESKPYSGDRLAFSFMGVIEMAKRSITGGIITKGLNKFFDWYENKDTDDDIINSESYKILEEKYNYMNGRGKYVTSEMHKKWMERVFQDDDEE
jgi:hypothetical protein